MYTQCPRFRRSNIIRPPPAPFNSTCAPYNHVAAKRRFDYKNGPAGIHAHKGTCRACCHKNEFCNTRHVRVPETDTSEKTTPADTTGASDKTPENVKSSAGSIQMRETTQAVVDGYQQCKPANLQPIIHRRPSNKSSVPHRHRS